MNRPDRYAFCPLSPDGSFTLGLSFFHPCDRKEGPHSFPTHPIRKGNLIFIIWVHQAESLSHVENHIDIFLSVSKQTIDSRYSHHRDHLQVNGKSTEQKFLQNGGPPCTFSPGTSKWYTKDSEQKGRTEWHNVVFFGKLAAIAGNTSPKDRTSTLRGA